MPSDKYSIVQRDVCVDVEMTQVLEVNVHLDPQCTIPIEEFTGERVRAIVDQALAQKRRTLSPTPVEDENWKADLFQILMWWKFESVQEMSADWYILRYTLGPVPVPIDPSPGVSIHITAR